MKIHTAILHDGTPVPGKNIELKGTVQRVFRPPVYFS